MKLEELINFGFKHFETKIEHGIKKHFMSKLISRSKIPPFHVKLVSIDATNGEWWQLIKDDVVISIITNIEELEKAMFVVSCFTYDCGR